MKILALLWIIALLPVCLACEQYAPGSGDANPAEYQSCKTEFESKYGLYIAGAQVDGRVMTLSGDHDLSAIKGVDTLKLESGKSNIGDLQLTGPVTYELHDKHVTVSSGGNANVPDDYEGMVSLQTGGKMKALNSEISGDTFISYESSILYNNQKELKLDGKPHNIEAPGLDQFKVDGVTLESNEITLNDKGYQFGNGPTLNRLPNGHKVSFYDTLMIWDSKSINTDTPDGYYENYLTYTGDFNNEMEYSDGKLKILGETTAPIHASFAESRLEGNNIVLDPWRKTVHANTFYSGSHFAGAQMLEDISGTYNGPVTLQYDQGKTQLHDFFCYETCFKHSATQTLISNTHKRPSTKHNGQDSRLQVEFQDDVIKSEMASLKIGQDGKVFSTIQGTAAEWNFVDKKLSGGKSIAGMDFDMSEHSKGSEVLRIEIPGLNNGIASTSHDFFMAQGNEKGIHILGDTLRVQDPFNEYMKVTQNGKVTVYDNTEMKHGIKPSLPATDYKTPTIVGKRSSFEKDLVNLGLSNKEAEDILDKCLETRACESKGGVISGKISGNLLKQVINPGQNNVEFKKETLFQDLDPVATTWIAERVKLLKSVTGVDYTYEQTDTSGGFFGKEYEYKMTGQPVKVQIVNDQKLVVAHTELSVESVSVEPAAEPIVTLSVAQKETPNTEYVTYTIQKDDTLSGIAGKAGMTYQKLGDLNNIVDYGKIYSGQKLNIPKDKWNEKLEGEEPVNLPEVKDIVKSLQGPVTVNSQTYVDADNEVIDISNQIIRPNINYLEMGMKYYYASDKPLIDKKPEDYTEQELNEYNQHKETKLLLANDALQKYNQINEDPTSSYYLGATNLALYNDEQDPTKLKKYNDDAIKYYLKAKELRDQELRIKSYKALSVLYIDVDDKEAAHYAQMVQDLERAKNSQSNIVKLFNK